MKFYETADVNFFVDVPNKWDMYSRYAQRKTWAVKSLNRIGTINYYRDHEGAWLNPDMKRHALYLQNFKWHKSRIIPWACLPQHYANGNRFIKLEKSGPAGFKCAPFPLNLKEMKAKIIELQLEKQRKQREKWFKKMKAAECKKRMKKKSAQVPPAK